MCVRNEGYEVSLELRKIYQNVADPASEWHSLVRIIDESREDYLYPQHFFLAIELPKALDKAMLAMA